MSRNASVQASRLLGLAALLWVGLNGAPASAQSLRFTKLLSEKPMSTAELRAAVPSWGKLGPAAKRQIRRMAKMEGATFYEGAFSSTPLGLWREPCIAAVTPDGKIRAVVSPLTAQTGSLSVSASVSERQVKGAVTIVADGAGSLLRSEKPFYMHQRTPERATVPGTTVVRLYVPKSLGKTAKALQGLPGDAVLVGQEMIYLKGAGPRAATNKTFPVFRSGPVDAVPSHDRYGQSRIYTTYQTWEGDLFHEKPGGRLQHVPRGQAQ